MFRTTFSAPGSPNGIADHLSKFVLARDDSAIRTSQASIPKRISLSDEISKGRGGACPQAFAMSKWQS